jgi:hypothetical protein
MPSGLPAQSPRGRAGRCVKYAPRLPGRPGMHSGRSSPESAKAGRDEARSARCSRTGCPAPAGESRPALRRTGRSPRRGAGHTLPLPRAVPAALRCVVRRPAEALGRLGAPTAPTPRRALIPASAGHSGPHSGAEADGSVPCYLARRAERPGFHRRRGPSLRSGVRGDDAGRAQRRRIGQTCRAPVGGTDPLPPALEAGGGVGLSLRQPAGQVRSPAPAGWLSLRMRNPAAGTSSTRSRGAPHWSLQGNPRDEGTRGNPMSALSAAVGEDGVCARPSPPRPRRGVAEQEPSDPLVAGSAPFGEAHRYRTSLATGPPFD